MRATVEIIAIGHSFDEILVDATRSWQAISNDPLVEIPNSAELQVARHPVRDELGAILYEGRITIKTVIDIGSQGREIVD